MPADIQPLRGGRVHVWDTLGELLGGDYERVARRCPDCGDFHGIPRDVLKR